MRKPAFTHSLRTYTRGAYILWVLIRFRLFLLLPDAHLKQRILFWCRWIPADTRITQAPSEQHLRLALTELGPLFVKLGQLLATRREWLPPAIAADLSALHDRVPGFDPLIAKQLIETELGQPVAHLFARFDIQPLASASLAQVHSAELKSGEAVVIKVLRPGVGEQVKQDLALFRTLATHIERRFPALRSLHLTRIADDYAEIVLNEIDLTHEAIQTQQFYHNFTGSNDLIVPKVYPELSTSQVLTLQRMYGTPINQIEQFIKHRVDVKQLAKTGVQIFLKQVFTDNFFHADMHPGNVHVDLNQPKQARYISLDNAIAGHLEPTDQLLLARQLLALMRDNYTELARLMILAGWVPKDTTIHTFAMTLRAICAPLINQPLHQIEFGPVLIKLFQAAERFQIRSLPQFVLLEKTLIHVEGLGTQLDPELDIWPILKPSIEQFVARQLSPLTLLNQMKDRLPDHLMQLPERLLPSPQPVNTPPIVKNHATTVHFGWVLLACAWSLACLLLGLSASQWFPY